MKTARTDAKRRVLDALKRRHPATASEIAAALQVTPSGLRQHLDELERRGLAERQALPPDGRGRPATAWSLTPLAMELFPDRHADLTVELIDAVRRAVGDEGLERVVEIRRVDQERAYRAVMPGPDAPLVGRVQALADQRSAEGYMAEVVEQDDGSCLLIEHHCPICEAAAACQGLCRAELEVFRASLGDGVSVEREQHLLAGDLRCVYRVTPTGG